jgi:hypothetical protein
MEFDTLNNSKLSSKAPTVPDEVFTLDLRDPTLSSKAPTVQDEVFTLDLSPNTF